MKHNLTGSIEVVRKFSLSDLSSDELLKLANVLNLNLNELQSIRDYFDGLHRVPYDVELYSFSQLWSEHCRHKVFRAVSYTHLTLPTICSV